MNFGTTNAGEPVDRITLTNEALSVSILTLGATLQDVRLAGVDHPLTLGGPDLAAYDGGPLQYNGSIVGPVGNRIRGAQATIDGKTFHFDKNANDAHVLHGGSGATHDKVWAIEDQGDDHLTLRLEMPDGLGGFPGNRVARAMFVLSGTALELTLTCTTDAPTWVNLANHSYWNLDGAETFAGHTLEIAADWYLPGTDEFIPTGEIRDVEGSAYDFRKPRQVTPNNPFFDTNFCLADARRDLSFACRLTGQSGVSLAVETTEPGVQIYDAWTLDTAPHNGFHGAPYQPHCGLAIEAQGWPNAPVEPSFPSIELRPDQTYKQQTRWTFDKG